MQSYAHEAGSLGARAEAAGVRFSVWSDRAREVSLLLYDRPGEPSREVPLGRSEEPSTFVTFVRQLRAGALYNFKVDGQVAVDPYARCLPFGVHGPARVVSAFAERTMGKRRVSLGDGEVIYELHIGTFTPEGSFESARQKLPDLRELGVTTIELMPIASFAGSRGWGYDGVGLFAPFASYGTPEQLSDFVDAVHAQGMSVILDVVYNHLGPAGNSLPAFSDSYFDSQRKNPWGNAPALEQAAFRRLVLDNARYWLESVGFDGLRLDATHELEPGGEPHILRELSAIARGCKPPAFLVAEDNRNDPTALLGHGIDAVWSDDFHHVLHVLLTSEQDGYYGAYQGTLTELARVIERSQLYEGQEYPPTQLPRGKSAAGVAREYFVFALQNHDQIGNRAQGDRLSALCSVDQYRAASLLFLFLPFTPMLFMGQEWACGAPFLYFSDHEAELGAAVSRGRREEFAHFAAFKEGGPEAIPDPQAESSFQRSKLDWSERRWPEHHETLSLHRRALELRRTDPVLNARSSSELRAGTQSGVLWVIRRGPAGERLFLFNPGPATSLAEVQGRSPANVRPLLFSQALASSSSFELPSASATLYALESQSEST